METEAQHGTRAMPGKEAAGVETAFDWMNFGLNNAQAVFEAFQGTVRYVSACQEANLKFAQQRMDTNNALRQSLSDAKSMEDVVRTCTEYNREMIEDYIKQGQDIGNLSLAAVKDFTRPLEDRAQAAAEHFRKAA